nr:YhdH/YhfP family quinone oxidoreductase [uncultured Draconibacterium sp.]
MKQKKTTFKAFRVVEESGNYTTTIKKMPFEVLKKGDLLIKVQFSSLNYKDALSIIGNKGVTKNYPHTPGIDAAGVVESSNSDIFEEGDLVIVTSYELGMNHPGGFAEYIKVPDSWVVKMPKKMNARKAMIYGTAGFTAALSIYRLLNNGQKPEMGPIVVTGALGGVGSIACQILNKLGFEVIAASYQLVKEYELREIGVSSQIDRSIYDDKSEKPLLKPQWAGAVDVVGGNSLTTMLKGCMPLGNVSTCGNIGSGDLKMTVYPFILRGISLIGIDSQNCPMEIRQKVWSLLSDTWAIKFDENLVKEASLETLKEHIDLMLEKKSTGRIIVKI